MTDRIQKVLRMLSSKERRQIVDVVTLILRGEFVGLDVKKLQGRDDVFRVRKGHVRIIYRKQKEEIFIIAIERRSEKTYRGV